MRAPGVAVTAVLFLAAAALARTPEAEPSAARTEGADRIPREAATVPTPGAVAPAAFRPATTCRPCHAAIYDEWKTSAMARSVEHSAWSLDATLRVLRGTGEEEAMRELCYACHAPFVRHGGPLALDAPLVHEGVSCDYCHSLRAVEASPAVNVATVVPGDVKTGPRGGSESPGHGTLEVPAMRRSEFCAGCHYFAWPETGMPIDWTYAQWAASPYRRENVECQDCHMPRRPGRASELAGVADRGGVASHRFPGARDPAMLERALELRARREGTTAVITIENVGAGHNVPGGGGELRELELRFVRRNAPGEAEVRRYRVRYFDEDGEEVAGSDDSAVRFEDTTIKARETRVERFALAEDATAQVELRYWYVSEAVAMRDATAPASVLVASATLAPETAPSPEGAPSPAAEPAPR